MFLTLRSGKAICRIASWAEQSRSQRPVPAQITYRADTYAHLATVPGYMHTIKVVLRSLLLRIPSRILMPKKSFFCTKIFLWASRTCNGTLVWLLCIYVFKQIQMASIRKVFFFNLFNAQKHPKGCCVYERIDVCALYILAQIRMLHFMRVTQVFQMEPTSTCLTCSYNVIPTFTDWPERRKTS
jgi:hypothetical protein